MTLDTFTLLVGHALIASFAAAALALYGRRQKIYPGYWHYVAGTATMTAGYVLFTLRVLPGLAGASVVGANAFFILSAVLRVDATRRFLAGSRVPGALYALPVAAAAWCAWFHYTAPRAGARALFTGAALILCAIPIARLHLAAAREAHPALHRLMAALFLLIGGAALANGIALLARGDEPAAPPLAIALLGFLILAELGVALGVALLNAARLEEELVDMNRRLEATLADAEATAGEIRTLEGLFPLCPACHRVRDDDGYWKRIERYVAERTGGSFSHGLCPACAEEPDPAPPDPRPRPHPV